MLDAIDTMGASDLDLLTQDLQSCLQRQNIDEALKLAEKRHKMIVALFQDLERVSPMRARPWGMIGL